MTRCPCKGLRKTSVRIGEESRELLARRLRSRPTVLHGIGLPWKVVEQVILRVFRHQGTGNRFSLLTP